MKNEFHPISVGKADIICGGYTINKGCNSVVTLFMFGPVHEKFLCFIFGIGQVLIAYIFVFKNHKYFLNQITPSAKALSIGIDRCFAGYQMIFFGWLAFL